MVRHIALGNGSLLVNLDKWMQVRDMYFPHVGQENHLLGHAHKIGLFTDHISWINDDSWERTLRYKKDTLVSDCSAKRKDFEIKISDCVLHDKNIYLRKLTIVNDTQEEKEATLYFYHDFHLYGDGVGDTAAYDPSLNAIFHYKRKRYFLINTMLKSSLRQKDKFGDLHEFNIGEADGTTIHDSHDNRLEKNPIRQGQVESIFSVRIKTKPKKPVILYYWISCGKDYKEVADLDVYVRKKHPEKLLKKTEKYWKDWLKNISTDLKSLDNDIKDLFKRSLLVIKTQMDNNGAILAANDSDNRQFNRDTYSYVWPRDGALVSMALQKAGFCKDTEKFYEFCKDVQTSGFLLHKFNPDKSLGSSWHPYFAQGEPQLPIQEDETALVIVSLLNHYKCSKDRKFLKKYYPLVKNMAEFMSNYRYKNTGLPRESYDLWEEKRGIFTFTCSTVCAGLHAAAYIAEILKDEKNTKKYRKAGKEVHDAVAKNLYDKSSSCFAKTANFRQDGSLEKDHSADSSVYSTFYFGGFQQDDEMISNTISRLKDQLWVNTEIGGMARYKKDYYHNKTEDWEKVPGNPWIISTLWLAKYYIKNKNLKKAEELLRWVVDRALPTGILPEQVDPFTGEALSVSPLSWSHAEFIDTICDLQQAKTKNRKNKR